MKKQFDNDIDALIVEDEIDICFLLTGILRKKNLHTAYVNNIHDAKSMLITEHPSIMFLDNNLPDGSGVDYIRVIKNSHPLMRIIMITADDTVANKNKALKAGADFFIGKPFTMDQINKTVDMMLKEVN